MWLKKLVNDFNTMFEKRTPNVFVERARGSFSDGGSYFTLRRASSGDVLLFCRCLVNAQKRLETNIHLTNTSPATYYIFTFNVV